jgi:hypothetical protein
VPCRASNTRRSEIERGMRHDAQALARPDLVFTDIGKNFVPRRKGAMVLHQKRSRRQVEARLALPARACRGPR